MRSARFRRRALLALLPGLLLLSGPAARGGEPPPEFKLIAHPSVTEARVSRDFVTDAFLKHITRWSDDEAIHPVDQRADSSPRKKFSAAVLRRTVAAVKTYWQQRIFSGRGVPPPELDSDEDVVRYVEAHPGSVGYISGTAAVGKTRVLTVTQ